MVELREKLQKAKSKGDKKLVAKLMRCIKLMTVKTKRELPAIDTSHPSDEEVHKTSTEVSLLSPGSPRTRKRLNDMSPFQRQKVQARIHQQRSIDTAISRSDTCIEVAFELCGAPGTSMCGPLLMHSTKDQRIQHARHLARVRRRKK